MAIGVPVAFQRSASSLGHKCSTFRMRFHRGDVDFVLGPSELPGKFAMLGFAVCSLDWHCKSQGDKDESSGSVSFLLSFFDGHETLELCGIFFRRFTIFLEV